MTSNPCGRTRPVDNPYETYVNSQGWEWRVLKKYHLNDLQPNARWYVAVKSPFTYDEWEYGDEYAANIMEMGVKL